MKVFQFQIKIFILLSIFPSSVDTSYFIRILNILMNIIGLIFMVLSPCANAMYIKKNIKINLVGSLDALYQMAVLAAISYTAVILFILRHKLMNVIEKVQQISDKCKYDFSHFKETTSDILIIRHFSRSGKSIRSNNRKRRNNWGTFTQTGCFHYDSCNCAIIDEFRFQFNSEWI